ncbi:putative membrane protein [[Clostridium] sordellii ATCC 9714]|nr:putative membrane protein [[Clostridium] sordellii ATCC 9714] [Paeniclostridium sordellii ATCC 9714]
MYRFTPTYSVIRIAIIIVISVKALIRPSCPFIILSFLFKFSLYHL